MKHYMLFLVSCFWMATIYTAQSQTFLVFGGKTGWIGQKLVKLIEDGGHIAVCATSRLENRQDITTEIEQVKPDFIINAAGITGRPNIDWCEDHKQETMRVNFIGTLNLIDICHAQGIHLTNISTGCIYYYDEKHPLASGKGFTEQDEPNFTGSFYSYTKVMLEKFLFVYPETLHLRIKMPISDDLNTHGFVGKILQYKKLVNIPNSMSILDDMLPLAVDMTLHKRSGIYNLVNPGTLSHNEVMDLYKQYINPNHQYENFTVEEQEKILKAGRSNSELDASKLLQLYPAIPHVKDSIVRIFERMSEASHHDT